MGTLTLPSTGPIYLDASGSIDSVERIEPYCTLLEPMWRQARVVRKRHPGYAGIQLFKDRLDARVRGNDHAAASAVC